MRHLIVILVFGLVWHYAYGRGVNFSEDFIKIGSKYYYISDSEKLDWFDARDKCLSMDAHLVSIQNFKEWEAITDHLTHCKSYWVDIRNIDDEYMSDTTGMLAPFFKWDRGQPKMKYDYDCVKLQRRCHRMKTKYCSQVNYYICEANRTPKPAIPKPEHKYEIIDLRY